MTCCGSSLAKGIGLSVTALVFWAVMGRAQTNVLTWHNDQARTGQNLNEAILTPSQVNSNDFGLLANVVVDGKVDAQPLYVSALSIPNAGSHNVLFIATEHDSVYAVDADSGKIYWQKSMLGPGEMTSDDRNCGQVTPEIGITATPVIDPKEGAYGTMYLVAMSKNASGRYFQRIHALNLSTGAELLNGPVTVGATYRGTGDGSSEGTVFFDPKQYKERPGLLLLNGKVYTSWGSHCDSRPYTGWLMANDEKTLAQTNILNFEPNGHEAAPWNAGAGPAADSEGNVYLALGNGQFDTQLNSSGFPSKGDFGNSLVKVSTANGKLSVVDYWTMYNSQSESWDDTDLGSGGLMLLPDMNDATGKTRHLSVAAGKDHNLYVADRDNMGHYDATNDGTIYQQLTGALPGGVWSSPAYYNGRIYYGPVGSSLRSFEIGNALISSAEQTTPETFGYPGTTPSVSAYGSNSGIVWAMENTNPAILHSYEAGSLSSELYNSNQAANSRDHFGAGNKFVVPTIANGKVYVATTNSVGIFGFVRQSVPPLSDGDYVLKNMQSQLVLEDPNGYLASGVELVQNRNSGGTIQKWFFSFNGRGYYTVQNVVSGLFLADPNGSKTPGTLVEQQTPSNDDSQLWSLVNSGTGFVIKNKQTGLVLDDLQKSQAYGAHVGLSAANGAVEESWTFIQ